MHEFEGSEVDRALKTRINIRSTTIKIRIMKELNIEEMTALRGGFKNKAVVISKDNEATSTATSTIRGSANRSGGLGAVMQAATASAGNQSVTIDQS